MTDTAEIRDRILSMSPEELTEVRRSFDPVTWCTDIARIMLPKSGPLEFDDHPFMRRVYRDLSNEVVIIKGAQMGFSTMSIMRALWAVTNFPMSVIYTFPTKGDVSTFTAARINPIISSSIYLKDRIQDFDSVGMKQFARVPREEQQRLQARGIETSYSTIYFNGSQNEKDATSVDADLLIHDEEDRSNPNIIEQYQSRIYHSSYKWVVRLSTPTIPGTGIDRQWKRSDQHIWMVRCSGCNEVFELDFPRNIEPETYEEVLAGHRPRYKCHRCNKTITNEQRINGKWIRQRDDVTVRGYSISQMSSPIIPPEHILEQYSRAIWKSNFWNLVMGRPHEEGTNVMTKEAIKLRADEAVVGAGMVRQMERTGSTRGCTIGVDVGKYLDVIIGKPENGIPRVICMKRLSGEGKWRELDQLMYDYGVISAVIDWQPEEEIVRQFAKRWPGRVWRCRYLTNPSAKEIKKDEAERIITVPRTEILSRSATEIVSERIFPAYDGSPVWEDFLDHCWNSKKVPVWREGQERDQTLDHYVWREVGPDHLFHAATYEMIARMVLTPTIELPNHAFRSFNRSENAGVRPDRDQDMGLLLPGMGVRRLRH